MDTPKCHVCKNTYNLSIHKPYILAACGHSICALCLETQIGQSGNGQIHCRIDGTVSSPALRKRPFDQ